MSARERLAAQDAQLERPAPASTASATWASRCRRETRQQLGLLDQLEGDVDKTTSGIREETKHAEDVAVSGQTSAVRLHDVDPGHGPRAHHRPAARATLVVKIVTSTAIASESTSPSFPPTPRRSDGSGQSFKREGRRRPRVAVVAAARRQGVRRRFVTVWLGSRCRSRVRRESPAEAPHANLPWLCGPTFWRRRLWLHAQEVQRLVFVDTPACRLWVRGLLLLF